VVGERQAQPNTDAARAAALAAKEQELTAALAVVKAAYGILGSRALVVLSAGASIGAFGYAIWQGSFASLLGACAVTACPPRHQRTGVA
jgi:hypothetical protein